MPQDPERLQRQRDLLKEQDRPGNTASAPQPQAGVDMRPAAAPRMQLEGPLSVVAAPATSHAGGMVPDISDIEPEDDREVDSDDPAPARPPGLVRAGGLPQAVAAAIPGAAAGKRAEQAQPAPQPPPGLHTANPSRAPVHQPGADSQ
eukprot:3197581-Alexandrium_andersonii.AAC.1